MHNYMEYARFKNLRFDNLEEIKLDSITGGSTMKTYMPLLNIYGPYFFYPPHCHPRNDTSRFHSPVIGVFKNHNEIEDDIINSL